MTFLRETFSWDPNIPLQPPLGQCTLTLYIIIICHHLIHFLAWKPITYALCGSHSGLLKTQVRSHHYPTSILYLLSLAVTIKSKQLKMIYKSLNYLILSATSATQLFFWLHSSHMSLLWDPQIPPQCLCMCCSLYIQCCPLYLHTAGYFLLFCHRYNVISPERPPLPDHLLVNANFTRLFSLSIWIFSS